MAVGRIARAQALYPYKPVRMIVAFPAGGTTAVLAHLAVQKAGETLGQQVVIDNRTGAGGTIGTKLRRAPDDGYMLTLGTTSTHVVAVGEDSASMKCVFHHR